MYRRALARHRTGATLLLGLSLRAPTGSAEPEEPIEARAGTVEGKAAKDPPTVPEPRASPAAPIVAPRLIRDEGVAYPQQALDERFYERVEIRLILELGASGHVRSSSVETPQGHGFDEEATRAARELLFEPALRAGVPVPARIRYRYVFEVPGATLVGQITDAATGSPVLGASLHVEIDGAEAQQTSTLADGSFALPALRGGNAIIRVESSRHLPQQTSVQLVPGDEARVLLSLSPRVELPGVADAALEVTVRGQRSAPGVSSYTREEVRRIPGAFGDPFRAVEALPGVTPVASGLPYFYVRGAPPGNVGYFLDRVRVPYLYHIGFGPSVIHPGLIERVDLYPGGYPARFGRFAGGVVSAETRDPEPALSGEANLRLFDVGGLIETPFASGRGSLLLAGRYSYSAALLSLLSPEVKLDYRDYQLRATYEPSARDRFSVFGFGSYDLLGEKKNGILNILFGTEFYRMVTGYERTLDSAKLESFLTLGYERTSASFVAGERRNVINRSLDSKSVYGTQLSQAVSLATGVDIAFDEYRVEPPKYADPDSPETRDFELLFPARTDFVAGGWLELALDVTPSIQVTPGVRVDLYTSGSSSAWGIDPRIAARFTISPWLRLVHAYGLAHQLPSFVLPLPGFAPAQLEGGLQRSIQASAGAEVDLDADTLATGSVFYNAFFDMSDALGTSSGDGPPDFDVRSRGSAVGAELYVKRRLTRRLGGFLSYTLSRSLRQVNGETFPSSADRTHVVNTALSYTLGRGWTIGGRFVFYTGTPVQPSVGGAAVPRTRDVPRTPLFFRLDTRFEKRWVLGEAWLSLVLEVMNATLSQETFGSDTVGPIVIPSLGLEAGF